MDETTRATNERSLDPGESWGQGTDASHTETAAEEPLPRDVGTDPGLAADTSDGDADDADSPPMT